MFHLLTLKLVRVIAGGCSIVLYIAILVFLGLFFLDYGIVSEMTYNVSMGTLNPTILYYYTS